MKTFLFTVLVAIFSLTANAQQQKPITTPGSHLVKARNNFMLGTGIQLVGGLMLASGGDPDQSKDAAIVMFGIGFLFQANAWIHVGKAGKEMNRQKIGFALSGNGATIRYTF